MICFWLDFQYGREGSDLPLNIIKVSEHGILLMKIVGFRYSGLEGERFTDLAVSLRGKVVFGKCILCVDNGVVVCPFYDFAVMFFHDDQILILAIHESI